MYGTLLKRSMFVGRNVISKFGNSLNGGNDICKCICYPKKSILFNCSNASCAFAEFSNNTSACLFYLSMSTSLTLPADEKTRKR